MFALQAAKIKRRPGALGTGTSVALKAAPGSAICHPAAEVPSTVNRPARIGAGNDVNRSTCFRLGSSAVTAAGIPSDGSSAIVDASITTAMLGASARSQAYPPAARGAYFSDVAVLNSTTGGGSA